MGDTRRHHAEPSTWPQLHSRRMGDPLFDTFEREQLCDLLVELGPDAPTLLRPWTTHDLAAHLVLREHDYLAAPELVLPGLWGRFAERRRTALARKDFHQLVASVRSGPPRGFFRLRWVRRFPNLNEFFVHHEDVRRANGQGPRVNTLEMDEALWHNVCRAPWFLARRLRDAGLELSWTGTTNTVRARTRATHRSHHRTSWRVTALSVRSTGRCEGRSRRARRCDRSRAVRALRHVNFGVHQRAPSPMTWG